MIDLGTVRPGSTIYIPWDTFDGGTGASITSTGLAVTDIEVYKDGSMTQRGSDSGFTLLDTDGIDLDGITGIQGISINLADNTTAGFWSAGARYYVVVSSVTIDAQTVNFIAATFDIGYPAALLNTTIATLSTQTSFTLTAGPAEDDALNGCVVVIHDVASAVQMGTATVLDYTGSTRTVTLAAGTTFTAAATDNISVFAPVGIQSAAGVLWASGAITAAVVADNTIDAASIATGAITSAKFAAGAIDAAAIATDAIGAAELADGAITAATFAASAIDATAIATGAITAAKFAAGAIDAAAIANGAIDAATFAAGAIDAAAIATNAIDADALAADAVAEIADGVWDEDATAHQTQGTFGQAIGDPAADTNTIYKAVVTDAAGATVGVDVVAVQADTDNIQTRIPAALVSGRIDASVGAVATGAITAAGFAAGAIDAAAIANGAIDAATFAAGAIDATAIANGAIDAATFAAGAIDAAAIATGAIDADALAADAVTEIWAKAMADLSAVPGATASVLDALNFMFMAARNVITQTATTTLIKKDDGTTTMATSTVSDSAGTYTRGEFA